MQVTVALSADGRRLAAAGLAGVKIWAARKKDATDRQGP
jgi:hypothetical protein